jgi:GH24 family phage-related lysozyme (muramidase)
MPERGDPVLSISERTNIQQATYDELKNSIFSSLHVADIGTITAVGSENLITVKPIIRDRIVGSDGKITWKDPPEIPDTPYLSIGGAAPAVGQSVLIIYCDKDFSGWIKQGGQNASGTPTAQNQEILRPHDISNAVAIVGFGVTVSQSTSYGGQITASTANNGTGVSDALVKFIESYEGWVATPYNDSGGTPTIGFGHTFTPPWTGPNPLTREQGEAMLKSDLSSFINSVKNIFSDFTLKQNEFDALVSFVYNLGAGRLKGSKLERDIRSHASSATLKADFEEYCHAHGKVLPGLVHRRDAEWAMFCNGVYISH